MARLVLLVGEAWGETEEAWKAPFVGASGIELNEELADAGWLTPSDASTINRALYAARNGSLAPNEAVRQRDRIFAACGLALANVVAKRPPGNKLEKWFLSRTEGRKHRLTELHGRFANDHITEGIADLQKHITALKPSLIICLGGTPLWALHGADGITRWRGSILHYRGDDGHNCPLIPTLHPAAVLREWPWRPIVVHDLKRARHERDEPTQQPDYRFTVRPGLECTLDSLADLSRAPKDVEPLVADTETIGGHIDCIGFADNDRSAICIPFLDPGQPDGNYWRCAEEEAAVVLGIKQVALKRPLIFHNGLYDCQIMKADWGFWPRWEHDTMVAQHVAFPGLLGAGIDPVTGATSKRGSSLSLAFCASMYCSHYVFWKDDGRLWDPAKHPPEQHWRYNCEDCVRTWEVHTALQAILHSAGLSEAYTFQCLRLGPATLRIMQRGLRMDRTRRAEQLRNVHSELASIEQWFERVLTHPLNPQSNPQMKALFYDDLRCPEQYTGKGDSRRLTCDDEALSKINRARPYLSALIQRCQDYRTLAVLGGKATAANRSILTCRLDEDNRLRTTLNLCGAETFRYSSGPTAHGTGCNVQNILKVRE